jgi:hypothetical protein
MKSVQRNIDVNGKTRPTSIEGIASPKVKNYVKEAEGIVEGDAKTPREGTMQQRRKP